MLAALAGICLASKLLEFLITQRPISSPVLSNVDMYELLWLNLVLTPSYKELYKSLGLTLMFQSNTLDS